MVALLVAITKKVAITQKSLRLAKRQKLDKFYTQIGTIE